MVRFKVVRASRLLLVLALIVLAAVLCVIGVRYALLSRAPSVGVNARLVQGTLVDEAKISVFASNVLSLLPEDGDAPDGIVVELAAPTASPVPVKTAAPRSVLIYHTHTHEAYEQESDDPYEAVEAWRTTDSDHSVVRVGRELAKCLRERGFEVVHDTTDHEGDALSTAYTRSLDTLLSYQRAFDLYIDLHRDAWIDGMNLRYLDADGTAIAQPMLLIGNGNGFDEKPFYEQNLAFARDLTRRVNEIKPGLCRDVMVKDGRYNQHIGVFAVLIEVGHNKNTLKEALAAVPTLAEAIKMVYDEPGPELKGYMAGREG